MMNQKQSTIDLVGRERKFEQYLPVMHHDISPTAKLLYIWLTMLGDGVDVMRYPGHMPAAELFGMSRQTIGRAFDDLVASGMMKCNGRTTKGATITLIRDCVDENVVRSLRESLRIIAIPPRLLVAKMAAEQAARSEVEAEQEQVAESPSTDDQSPVPSGAIESPQEPRSRGRRKKGSSMDQATVRAITQDFDSMTKYILFGQRAVLDDRAELVHTQLSWRTIEDLREDNMQFELWNTHQFAGYYWWLVSWHRNNRNVPQTIPNWGRLLKDVGTLQGEMPNEKVGEYIQYVVREYRSIIARMKNLSFKPQLDDAALSNRLLRQAFMEYQDQPVEAV
jgi:hypothetical protein